MELPQPSRPFTAEGRKATHDFLSLYGHSPVQQDPRPSSHGGYLTTHNFLQPLEKEDNTDGLNVEKPSPPSATPPIEPVFPGGIPYTINHVAYLNPRMPKSEGTAFNMVPAVSNNDRNDENSNCSSYTAGSSFTLWDESSSRKGKTGKENSDDLSLTKEAIVRTGQWPIERPSESSSNHHYSLSSRSSSQPPAQKNQSFVQMLIAAKIPHAKEEDEDEVFTLRKEGSSQKRELRINVDGRASNDKKANTPRSKHSATEQRRRCKINDRFQTLRKIIPNSDQKRDKASFLLEVIEYIQFLQEKVSRYEGYPGCSSEPTKLTPWRSNPKLTGSFADQSDAINGPVMFTPDDKNNIIASNFQKKQQNPSTPASNNSIPLNSINQQTKLTNTVSSIPIPQLQADVFPSLRNTNAIVQPVCKLPASDADNASLPMPQLCQNRPRLSEINSNTGNEEMAVEGGTISISSTYSQGLLNTLTQALKSSGVDVSQANISVQVDIGKQANPTQNAHKASKDFDINCDSVDTSLCEESNHTAKRLKTGMS